MTRHQRNKDGSYSVTGNFLGRCLVAEGNTVDSARDAYVSLMFSTQEQSKKEVKRNVAS